MFPAAAGFLTNVKDIKTVHEAQRKKCNVTMEGHISTANKINKNKDVMTTAIFFKFPFTCTADLESDVAPSADQKAKVSMFDEMEIEAEIKSYKIKQAVEPCYFNFREIVNEDDVDDIGDVESGSDSEVDDYFKGKAATMQAANLSGSGLN